MRFRFDVDGLWARAIAQLSSIVNETPASCIDCRSNRTASVLCFSGNLGGRRRAGSSCSSSKR